jgi:hypothetical protein
VVTGYTYEVWKANKLIGTVYLMSPVQGKFVEFPELSSLKQPYNQKPKIIHVPVDRRIEKINYCQAVITTILNVSKKSKRQIKIILGGQKW